MMYNPEVEFCPGDFIQTSAGNIVSRSAVINKATSVELPGGKCIISKDVVIRGDLAAVQINKYSFVGIGTVLQPSFLLPSTTTASTTTPPQALRYIPLTIGSHCFIGSNCVIEAAIIGMGCTIGDNCVLSKRCILKDFVVVEAGSIVPSDMVAPPFSILSGSPAVIVGEAAECSSSLIPSTAVARYRAWRPTLAKSSSDTSS